MPYLGIIEQVKAVETANWNSVRPTDRYCEEFDVTWLEESDTPATVLSGQSTIHRPLCDIDGEELQSNRKTYKLDNIVRASVKIKDEDCGNMFDAESKVSLALLQAQKKILVGLAQTLPPRIDAYAGANLLNGSAYDSYPWNIGEAGTSGTDIGYDDLDSLTKTMFYLSRMYQVNKLQNPKIIDGGILAFQEYLATIQKGASAADIGSANAWQFIADGYKQDFVNMMAAGYADNAFVIDQGNLALPIVSYFPRLGQDNEVVADKFIYSVPVAGYTLNGQPIYIDVTYTKEESQIGVTGRCEVVHIFSMELKFALWQAPKYASDTVTGIIKLNRADAA